MPRHSRIAPDGFIHHVMNRGDHRETIFHKSADFQAFLGLMAESVRRVPMRILAYCIMRNHFHLLLWPDHGVELSAYMQVLMNLHIQRYLLHYPPSSPGHIYQGRYTNSLVQDGVSFLTVMRYVEANALTAQIVSHAEDYLWSSASPHASDPDRPALAEGPIAKPADWLDFINTPVSAEVFEKIHRAAQRGAPIGDATWTNRMVTAYQLEHTVRDRGRPRSYEVVRATG
jgi:REP-associated tyrosine transposase